MGCVTSVTFSVLINGHSYAFIKPERGIRQGDPLSPFLFVICTEALIHVFNQAVLNGSITGIQYHLSSLAINHLLFANDSLFLCQASKTQCEEVLLCLHNYELMSGQQLNLKKLAITFGSKVTEDMKDWIKNRTDIQLEGGTGKYLGLPKCLSGSKRQLLGFIMDILQSKLTGWYAKNFSQGGKEVLLQSVAMALPVYAMSCFKLPKTTIKKQTSAMMEYWWSNSQSQHKIHWISHDRMTFPKSVGGFGFRDLELFNQALLAKQAWRLLYEPHCLFSRFFRSRYNSKTSFLKSKLGSRPSYGWRSILFGKNLLIKGLKRVIGDGKDTLVWIDKWIFDDTARRPIGIHSIMNICLRVSDLISASSGLWKVSLLRNLFHQDVVHRILSTKPLLARKDSYCWGGNRSGIYSAKSGYDIFFNLENKEKIVEPFIYPSIFPVLAECWKIRTAPKISRPCSFPCRWIQRQRPATATSDNIYCSFVCRWIQRPITATIADNCRCVVRLTVAINSRYIFLKK